MTRPAADLYETGKGVGFRIDTVAPSGDLAPYLSSFHSYHVRVDPGMRHEELFLPALGNIRLQPYGDDWSMRIAARSFDPVPRAALFGPTAHSGTAIVATGQIIGIYLRPEGWARLIRAPADGFADRIVSLADVWGEGADALLAAVSSHDGFADQVRAFEDVVRQRLARMPVAPEGVAGIDAVLNDPHVVTVEQALARLDMPDWKFARLSRRHIGFTPKLLMRRARFMRTILRIREQGDRPWAQMVDEAYVDQSHFIRDCRDFLDMTPVQFAGRFQPIARAAFDARAKALGQPHHLVTGDEGNG